MLVCGFSALVVNGVATFFIFSYKHLKLTLLLNKTVLVMFLLASTVTINSHSAMEGSMD